MQVIRFVVAKPQEETPFEFTVEPASPFQLPLVSGGTYNFTVDWGDGGSTDTITEWDDLAKTHSYSGSGPYTISISGTIIGWSFNNNEYASAMREIKSWGPLRLGNGGDYFKGCLNMTVTATDVLDLTGTSTLLRAFYDCSSLTNIPSINSWDVSNVTNMSYMFYGSYGKATIQNPFNSSLSSWNVSNVTNMSNMFHYCSFDQDISGWDVSSVTDMSGMFQYADFNQDIGGWTTSSLETVASMFGNANNFDQDLGSWDISSLTTANGMFDYGAFSTANYGALLIGWQAGSHLNNVSLGAASTSYPAEAAAARAILVNDEGWIINDDGQAI